RGLQNVIESFRFLRSFATPRLWNGGAARGLGPGQGAVHAQRARLPRGLRLPAVVPPRRLAPAALVPVLDALGHAARRRLALARGGPRPARPRRARAARLRGERRGRGRGERGARAAEAPLPPPPALRLRPQPRLRRGPARALRGRPLLLPLRPYPERVRDRHADRPPVPGRRPRAPARRGERRPLAPGARPALRPRRAARRP